MDLLNSDAVMRPLRVFLVENHQDTVKFIRLYLEHLGHEVTIARDMATALADFPKSKCDVLLSDISLPDGDGWQLMERMKERRPAFAIAMSGYGSRNDLHRSRSAGYNHHLVKPFPPADLIEVLREAGAVVGNQEVITGRDSSGVENSIEARHVKRNSDV
jgi:CheY-like chemotaxis protein